MRATGSCALIVGMVWPLDDCAKEVAVTNYPVRVTARPDAPGRWLWLVKWLLLIPHYLVLAVLWVAFVVLTAVAYVSVLFTGRFPQTVFDFNVGVLRWTWRVGYYGYWVLGTDRYPPFTLADVPDYPARLEIDGPPTPKRWLPLVAWLFAVPHILIVAALTTGFSWVSDSGTRYSSPGVATLAVLVVGGALLFTGRCPAGLRDLLVGAWRWYLRVGAYVALLTDRYPPFRLEFGDGEPTGGPDAPSGFAAPPLRPAEPSPVGKVAGVIAIIGGFLLVLTAGGLAVGGGTLLALGQNQDGDRYVSSRSLAVASPTAAVTVEDLVVHPGRFTGLDAVRITVTQAGETPLFLGVAAERDVDAWLAGTAHDQLTGLYNLSAARYDRASGTVRAVPNPTSQNFWLATATGTGTVTLNWTPGDGRFAIVLANVDGAPVVAADVMVAAKVPALTPFGGGLIAGAVVALLFAVALTYLGAVGLGGTTPSGGPTSGPPPPAGPPVETPPVPVLTGGKV
jgi:hypothetical protein